MNAALQTPHCVGPARTCPQRPAPRSPAHAAPAWPPLLRVSGPLAELIAGAIAIGAVVTGPWLG